MNAQSVLEREETRWNFVIVARGPESLFRDVKGLVEDRGGKVSYQKLSGYKFRVTELTPLESDSAVVTCSRCGQELFRSEVPASADSGERLAGILREHAAKCAGSGE